MVTLSLTGFRVAEVLTRAAVIVEAEGWHPTLNPLMRAIDAAAGYVPGKGGPAEHDTTLAAYDALAAHLMCPLASWEHIPGLTAADVAEALREAAAGAVAP